MRHRLLIGAALAAMTTGAAQAQSQAETVDAAGVLAANHQAVGALPATGVLRLEYRAEASGMTGVVTQTQDLNTGAFIDTYEVGPISGGSGFDGVTPWMRDFSGANTSQEGGDRVQVAVNEAYVAGNLWWRADRGGAEVSYVGRETVDGRAMDHLKILPKGGKPLDAWFDAATHLLARTAEEQLFFHTQVIYADYRRDGDVMRAHSVVMDEGVGEDGMQRLTLTRAAIGPAQPTSAFSRPTAPPTGMAIDGGAKSVTLPFRLLNNHIYVQATVNGKGPYTFIVDTGGHNLLSPRVVREAGLAAQGAGSTSGTGEKSAQTSYAKVGEIALGRLRMRDQTAIVTTIYDKAIEGIEVDGMVGFELFRRFAVEVDYGRQTITFTDPARFAARDAGVEIPFKFYDHLPFVEGSVDGLPAHFDIDTGSRSEIDLTSPFVEQGGFRARYPKGTTNVTGWGVGGPSLSYVVRLRTLSLGPVRIDGVAAALSSSRHGSFSDANYQGNVGSALLKRFVVTFDYARQRMYLKPIVPTPVDAGRFDRSGLWINAGPEGYVVTSVAAGGPGAQAGIAVGDVIVSIDGKPAVAEQLSDARILLRATPAGATVRLQVRRAGADRAVDLVLADQI